MLFRSVAINTTLAALQADVDGNEADADDAIAALQKSVDDESKSTKAAREAIQADVDANEADADAAIAAETERASKAEAALDAAALDAYKTDNDAALKAEVDARAKGDASLAQSVADMISNTDLSAVDSFSEMLTATNNALVSNARVFEQVQETTIEGEHVAFRTGVKDGSEKFFVNGLLQTEGFSSLNCHF